MTRPDVVSKTLPGKGNRHVAAAVSVNVIASALVGLGGVLATAYLARVIAISDFGKVMLLLSMVTAIAIFEGQRPVIIHRVASGNASPPALFAASKRINVWMCGVCLCVLAGADLAGAATGLSSTAKLALYLTIPVFFSAIQYWIFLDAEQDTVFTGLARSSMWLIIYASFILTATLGLPLWGYALGILVAHAGLFVALRLRFDALSLPQKYASRRGTELAEGVWSPSISNIVFNACAVTINLADRAIIGATMGVAATGRYSGPSELCLRVTGLVRAGVLVILPWAARLSPPNQQRYWVVLIALTMLSTGLGAVIVLLLREPIIAVVLGPAFAGTGDLFGLFVLGGVITTIGYGCIVQLNAQGDFTTQRVLYLAGAAVLVLGSLLGAHKGNLTIVAAAFLCARSVDLVILGMLVRKLPGDLQLRFFAITAALVAAIACAWVYLTLAAAAAAAIACGSTYLLLNHPRGGQADVA